MSVPISAIPARTERRANVTTSVRANPERRVVFRLHSYWEGLRRGASLPALADVSEKDLADIWPWCFVISAQCRFPPYQFQYLGSRFATYSSLYTGGERDSIADSTLMDKALEDLPEVFAGGKPICVEEEVPLFDRRLLLMRAGLFPLSDDGARVNFVIGAANGKVVASPG